MPVPSETTSASFSASEVPPIPIAVNSLTLTTGRPSSVAASARDPAPVAATHSTYEFEPILFDQLAERAGGRPDRVVGLDRDDMVVAVVEDHRVSGRTADIDSDDHRWCRLLSGPAFKARHASPAGNRYAPRVGKNILSGPHCGGSEPAPSAL